MTSEQLLPVVDEVVSKMVDSRGFKEFGPFAREALARYQEGSTAEEVQLDMIAWASKYRRNR